MKPRYLQAFCLIGLAVLATAAFVFLWEIGKPVAIAAVTMALAAVRMKAR